MIQTKDSTFQDDIKKDNLTIVDFWATWCGPRRVLYPVLEDIEKENNNSENT